MSTIKELQKRINDLEKQHQTEIIELNNKFDLKFAELSKKYEEKVDTLTTSIISFHNEIPQMISDAVQNAVKSIFDSYKTTFENIVSATADTVSKSFMNSLEIKEKQKNLVIVGMPEVDDNSDRERVYQMAKYAGIDDPSLAIKTTFRDGRGGKKSRSGAPIPRIIKVRFANKNYRKIFLTKGYKELGDDFSGLYVRPDLTFEEREADRALKAELRQRKSATGNENLVIKNGRIVDKTQLQPPKRQGNDHIRI